MDLHGFLKVIARRWPVALVCLLLGAAAGWTATALSTPEYEARAQLFVAARSGGDTVQLNQGQSFLQSRVQSYVAIVATRQVTDHVARELKPGLTSGELAGRIKAEAPLNTVLINIVVTDTKPGRAARVANAVALRFSDVVEQLETPQGSSLAPVSLGITQQAAVPGAPVSPKPLLNMAAGILGGLLLGAGLVVLLETLDTTLKSAEALSELTALPVLCSIPYDKAAPDHPLTTGDSGHSARAEAFRRLRTNLQFAQVDDRPRVMVVTSSLPGEGKTNTAANLAVSLAEAGVTTCLVDADLRRPCVARTFGLVQDAGLTTVLIGRASIAEVMQQGPSGLAVLTSGAIPPNPTELLASDRMGDFLRELASAYEAVIVDTAPLLPVADTVGLAPLAQGALLVVRASSTSREQVRTAASALSTVGVRTLGTVFSMAPAPKSKGYGAYGGYGDPRPEDASDDTSSRRMPPPRPSRSRPRDGVALSYLAGEK
ncbi:polysaccharide biosynthesis tyrosine autokinase [Streptomyces sp. NBC_01304]|uniref:polysaccharide biosynthesis tyrosine autokinase n=1 Tax=Streptomyces sp. NBC_01304 TaxID=2903818 RepID=UPI002E13AF64|nr:polysaccharide biosynthesis tyrosine autokinase [Streptomyces sp. NBC_01304]